MGFTTSRSTRMQFEPDELIGDRSHILSVFTDYLINYPDEEDENAVRTPHTQLKVYVLENNGYDIGSLNRVISNIAEQPKQHRNVEKYISRHKFKESMIEEDNDISYVEIETPEIGRTDQFIFWDDRDYLKILTAERREWTKKTIERLIDYVPLLEPILLSPSDLENVVDSLDGAFITGFTAKYHSFKEDRKVSIQVYGGSEEDLNKVRENFNARPTRIEFNQRNSPTDTVSSAITQEGLFSVSSIQPGYEERGVDTIEYLSQALEDRDETNFKIDIVPENVRVNTGMAVLGSTTVEMSNESSAEGSFEELAERVQSEILEAKPRYAYSSWEKGKYEVFDKETSDPFEITIEGESIRLHAKRGTSPDSFRNFCSYVYDLLNPTYSINNVSIGLKA